MAVAIRLDFTEPISAYDDTVKALGFQDGVHGADGLLFHWAEDRGEDGFTVRDVWASQEQADAFFARLDAMDEAPQPAKITSADVYNYMREAPAERPL